MKQFCFVLNYQYLQNTRDCIIYNHLYLLWKFLDVNLKMCDEAHTFAKFFLGNMQAKQCGDCWFSMGWGPGRPKLAAQLMGWPWLWAPVWALLFRRKGRLPTAGAWHINTCFWNKWTSLVSHSYSVFYSLYDPEQFAFLLNVFNLLEVLGKRNAKCCAVTLSQRVQRTSLGEWQSKSS